MYTHTHTQTLFLFKFSELTASFLNKQTNVCRIFTGHLLGTTFQVNLDIRPDARRLCVNGNSHKTQAAVSQHKSYSWKQS